MAARRRRRIRHSAPKQHVLIPELAIERWLFHDGLSVNDGRRVARVPTVEAATGIRDRLLEELAASGLDADRALDRALNEAAEAFRSQPPDFNESTTKVRIALETIARRAAPTIAAHRVIPAPGETWGAALGFLRMTAQLMTVQEVRAVSAVYTLISPGAHRPVGLTDEEWPALRARSHSAPHTF